MAWATPVLGNAVAGRYALAFLLILALSKILATGLTISIGGSGGVFAPSLFIGAMLGAAFGTLTHHLLPHLTGPPGAYALVGMGAVFAGYGSNWPPGVPTCARAGSSFDGLRPVGAVRVTWCRDRYRRHHGWRLSAARPGRR